MIASFRYLWRHHPVRLSAFATALLAAVFFGIRLIVFTLYWSDPANRNLPIEGWMTPRYVAMSWDIPRDVVGEALGLEPDGGLGPVTLDRLAEDQGIPTDALISRLETAIAAHKADNR